jgi:hypothetical protein
MISYERELRFWQIRAYLTYSSMYREELEERERVAKEAARPATRSLADMEYLIALCVPQDEPNAIEAPSALGASCTADAVQSAECRTADAVQSAECRTADAVQSAAPQMRSEADEWREWYEKSRHSA